MSPPGDQRFALVIGNNRYQHMPELRTAAEDARAAAQTLRNVGVAVTEVIDANRRTLLRARSSFAEQIRGGKTGIFWFSGHGVQLLGRNLLIPIDADVDDEHSIRDDSIDLDELLDSFISVAPHILIFIVDACRTSPFPDNRFRALLRPGLRAPHETSSGVLIVYSAGPNEAALDSLGPNDNDPNGLFAREFLPLLPEPGVPFTTLVRRARSSIREKAIRFTGREQVPHISDRLIPDFVLVPGEVVDKSLETIANADKLLRAHATVIQRMIFPHRHTNPISKEQLCQLMRQQNGMLSDADFDYILSTVIDRSLIPGMIFDGSEVYLLEEHARWKVDVEHDKKVKIGRAAASFVENGMKVFFDAGSTTEEIVKIVIRKIENRALTRLTLASTSINIADMISDSCVRMGFDDDFSAVQLYVPGGRIRPSTQAIVPAFDGQARQVGMLADLVGGFDIGFIGVNGIDRSRGFTTNTSAEATNKIDIMTVSQRKLIVGDSSKVGIVLNQRFAGFGDDLKLIIDDDADNDALQHLFIRHSEKILRA